MINYSNNRRILTECECSGEPRPAMEHNIDCPRRISFFGAPEIWGVGNIGEIRMYMGKFFEFSHTWFPTNKTIRDIRKEKIEKITIKK